MSIVRSVAAACVILLASGWINVFDLDSDVQLPIAELAVPESVSAQGPLNATHQYSINGPFANPLIVSAVQPDGTSFTKTVRVE